MSDNHWKSKRKKLIVKSNFYTLEEELVTLPNGFEMNYTKFDMPDFSAVVAVTNDKKILFVSNYRYPVGMRILEIPAGIIDNGESPMECAKRELEEETGYFANKIEEIVWYYSYASLNTQTAHIFFADELEKGVMKREKGEDLELKILEIEEALDKLHNNELRHPPTIIGLGMAEERLRKILGKNDLRKLLF